MSYSANKVETISRLAQWRIKNLSACTYHDSQPFKMGKWEWYLSLENKQPASIKLYPEESSITGKNLPIASFIIRLVLSTADSKALTHPEVIDKQLQYYGDFIWTIKDPLTEKMIIEVNFLDLKIASPKGGELSSIWIDRLTKKQSQSALLSLGKMLRENIHTDITINTSNGSVHAHRAILASRSPVFRSMFSHDMKEKELSTINISDMSLEACRAFLNFMYGNIEHEELLSHRLTLLHAADIYDLHDLKEACYEILVEDISAKNVLEKLQIASQYQLPELKAVCIRYLVKFVKILDIQDEFNAFLQMADKDLIVEIFHEVLQVWKGF